jgi:signal transduction histidine kinase
VKSVKNNILLYFIVATILATIGIQVYWNFINYQANKQELVNQVQQSLNNAVDTYYTEIAKTNWMSIIATDTVNLNGIKKIINVYSGDTISMPHNDTDSLSKKNKHMVFEAADSAPTHSFSFSLNDNLIDSVSLLNELAAKIVVSVTNDTIQLRQIKTLLSADFEERSWPIDFALIARDKNCDERNKIFGCEPIRSLDVASIGKNPLSSFATSAYLHQNTELEIQFSNISKILFRKSLIGIILSLALAVGIIACLFYLLNIIKRQKQVAEIKNDFINNMTHEFKTPITTITAAIESIQSFNLENDQVKNKKYLNTSREQLDKLNIMVEKILDIATLDSDQLKINKEPIDINLLITQLAEKHNLVATDKTIELKLEQSMAKSMVDPFHFENVVTNLMDNALKYGGSLITIAFSSVSKGFELIVSDNGVGIGKKEQSLLFDKFYRVPQGNIHNVKGFGIGLYYSRNIIEKHGGSLSVESHPGSTEFKIILDG